MSNLIIAIYLKYYEKTSDLMIRYIVLVMGFFN